jgi:hypothetical protein
MGPRAEAEAGPAPHGLLGELDHRADLRKIRHVRERIESRPHALNCISQGLPDFPAGLGQCFSEIGVPVIAHVRIVSPGRGPGLGTYTLRARQRRRIVAQRRSAAAAAAGAEPGYAAYPAALFTAIRTTTRTAPGASSPGSLPYFRAS